MLKQGTFINKRFNKLLLGCFWGNLAYAINLMTDSIISGKALGEVSLQAVSIVYPLFSLIYFFSYLIAPGAGVIFGKLIGEFNKDESSRVVGTTFIATLIVTTFLTIGLWILKIPFLTYYGCSGELMIEASSYYNWMILFAILDCISVPLHYFTVADGEALLVSISSVSNIVANVILSIILSARYGIMGLGLATCIGRMLSLISYLPHFLRKSNNVKFHLCFHFKYVKRSLYLSFSYYFYYIFLAIVDIVLNKIIIMMCGIEFIPSYAVINLVFGTCEIYESLTNSSLGLVTCFLGERNRHDMNLLFKNIMYKMFIMALGLCIIFFFGAPLMPKLFGLETKETIDAAITASKIVSFVSFGFGIAYVGANILYTIEKPLFSCFMSFLNDIVMPLLCSLVAGSLWGFTGIAIGMAISSYLAIIVYTIVVVLLKGKKGFPFYLEIENEESVSYDLYVTCESIFLVKDWFNLQLTSHGYNIDNIEILIEEFYTRILEKNNGKKVLSEVILLFSEKQVRIIIRNDGDVFNFVDDIRKNESNNTSIVYDLLQQTINKEYLVTADFNRDYFVFEK